MEINDAGLRIIKEFEGCKLSAYKDLGGIWTIGYGHVGGYLHEGMQISQEEASELLIEDISDYEDDVERALEVLVNGNQFSAMVSLCYNIGPSNFRNSTLLRMVNQGNFKDAANEFVRWDRVNGNPTPGLLRRRMAERDLFNLVTGPEAVDQSS